MRALIVTAVFLAACGGAGAPSGGTTESSAPSDPVAAPSGSAAATAGASANAGPAFSDLIRSGKLASYKVSYKMTGTGAGQSGGAVEQTWYFKPPNTRFDLSSDDGYGGTTKISMFFLETGSYMCTEAGGDKSCLQVSAEAAAQQNMGFDIQDSFLDDPAAFDATLREERTIAGQKAFCYVVKGAAAAMFSEGTFCYSATGIPLLSQWAAGGASFTMEATSFSATVADSDFTLPATPQKFP